MNSTWKNNKKNFDELEVIEMYIILLLGVVDRPIPSFLHLEKEMFILSKVVHSLSKILSFEKHYKGPYSDTLKELVEHPLCHEDAFKIIDSKIFLSKKGKKYYFNIINKYLKDENFKKVLFSAKMIRELYDKLSEDELLLLIYITYPEFTEKSIEYERIISSKEELAKKLLKKGLITYDKYEEIIMCDYE